MKDFFLLTRLFVIYAYTYSVTFKNKKSMHSSDHEADSIILLFTYRKLKFIHKVPKFFKLLFPKKSQCSKVQFVIVHRL